MHPWSINLTDREQAELRGSVKTCVEETIGPRRKSLKTTEYDLDGRLRTTRTSYADSGWVTTDNYDSGGRLVKTSWAKSGEPTTETLFAYDEAGKVKEIRVANGKGNLTSSRYDQQGRWTTYDADGRIMEENQIQANPAPTLPVELNDKQVEAVNKAMKSMMSGKKGTGRSFVYDSQGRVTEMRDRNFALDTVTTTSYNEHGDKSEERVTQTSNLAHPELLAFSIGEDGTIIPDLDLEGTSRATIFEFRYEYDQYGNWTERTTTYSLQLVDGRESGESSTVDHRTLTYF